MRTSKQASQSIEQLPTEYLMTQLLQSPRTHFFPVSRMNILRVLSEGPDGPNNQEASGQCVCRTK